MLSNPAAYSKLAKQPNTAGLSRKSILFAYKCSQLGEKKKGGGRNLFQIWTYLFVRFNLGKGFVWVLNYALFSMVQFSSRRTNAQGLIADRS